MRHESSAQIELPFMADDAGRALLPGPSPEEWRPIGDWIGYQVSDWGRVRSFWGKGGKSKGRRGLVETPKIIGGHVRPSGHHGVVLYHTGELKQYSYLVHRLVLEAFIGPCPPGMEACHNDGDPGNNRLDNLRWDTRANNQRDSLRHGTHRHAKLTEADIPGVWVRLMTGESLSSIAKDYNVSCGSISHVRDRLNWSHITDALPGTPPKPLFKDDAREPIHAPPRYLGQAAELWLPLHQHPNYRVSSRGRVQSRRKALARMGIEEWRDLNPSPDTDGYPGFSITDRSRPKAKIRIPVHRAVLEAFAGPCPDGMVACHIDGCRTNNCIDNLRWDTPLANVLDKIEHKAQVNGEPCRPGPAGR